MPVQPAASSGFAEYCVPFCCQRLHLLVHNDGYLEHLSRSVLEAGPYLLLASFEQKPDMEEQALALAGEAGLGLGANLRVIDAFIEGLRN